MQLGRRIVTIMASLALLQLVLLGSAVPCASPMPGAGHAEHVSPGHEAETSGHGAHAAAGSHAQHAHDAQAGGSAPSSECGVRACAAPPVILNGAVAYAVPAQMPAESYPPAGGLLSSPVSSLDPPPPRA